MSERTRNVTGVPRAQRVYRPLEMLTGHNGKNVFVKLKDGSEYMGKLKNVDYSMNMVLTDTREITSTNKTVAILGEVYIRGSNLLFVSLEPEKVAFLQETSQATQEAVQEQAPPEEE